jgi:hypothetical protein
MAGVKIRVCAILGSAGRGGARLFALFIMPSEQKIIDGYPMEETVRATDGETFVDGQAQYTRQRSAYWDDFARSFQRWERPRRTCISTFIDGTPYA